jgi:hypothetical protein
VQARTATHRWAECRSGPAPQRVVLMVLLLPVVVVGSALVMVVEGSNPIQ